MFKTRYFQWVICHCCSGAGSVSHPAFSNGFTSEEWSDMCNDYDADGERSAADRYMDGEYDVSCSECGGRGSVKQPDFRAMPREERRAYVAYLREQREEAVWRREAAAERRMGA